MYDLIIIGAGPAGLTAGLYAGRFRLNTLILEKLSIGGQIILSGTIENFPGFPGYISTADLIEKIKAQVDRVNVPFAMEEAVEISANQGGYSIKTTENTYQTKTVVIASGARAKRLGAPGEERLIGKGVSYCGTCDAPLFKNKEICVVGGGDRAIEEAIFLTSYASKVTLVHRRDEFRASKILVEHCQKNPKISFMLDSIIEEIIGQNRVEAVKIKNVKTGTLVEHPCQGVFVFVGINPNTGLVKNILQLDQSEFIITDLDMRTDQPGIFSAGDCRKSGLYQVVTACADGATAAHSAHKYLLNLK